jgi:tRNA pseudouridine38-40 synthase
VERTFKLIIEYDGSDFHGWQRQKKDRSVQETIEKSLMIMTREEIPVIASGRTDAGVHAKAQVACFKTRSKLDSSAFYNGLNSLLPDDVAIRACEPVPGDFHARFNAISKHYRYHIANSEVAPVIGRQYVWHIRRPLNYCAMRSAARAFLGTHDFKAFEGAGSPRAHTVRRVSRSEINVCGNDNLTYDIEANGFLRFMVRNIVGTLVAVGLGKLVPEEIHPILAAKDRSRAGATAPPQGLFLMAVAY